MFNVFLTGNGDWKLQHIVVPHNVMGLFGLNVINYSLFMFGHCKDLTCNYVYCVRVVVLWWKIVWVCLNYGCPQIIIIKIQFCIKFWSLACLLEDNPEPYLLASQNQPYQVWDISFEKPTKQHSANQQTQVSDVFYTNIFFNTYSSFFNLILCTALTTNL